VAIARVNPVLLRKNNGKREIFGKYPGGIGILLSKRQRKGIAGGVFEGILVKVQVVSDPWDSN
jgi:hypothetical protein